MTAPTPYLRRRFIKLAVAGAGAMSLGALMNQNALAAAVSVKETDAMAVALSYKVDALKAAARKDASATCKNCNLYSGSAGAAEGPCTLFQGNLVAASGWCSAWVKKV